MRIASLFRAVLLTAVSLALAVPPVAAGEAKYVFRYNSGLASTVSGPAIPETPSNPDQYDVTARFLGVVGNPFEADIPTKPGATVTSWRIESGTLPKGLSLDGATGTISGTPTEKTDARTLSVRGYAPSGEMGTYASVRLDVIQTGSYARRQEAYGHTGKQFHAVLSKPSGTTVYSWTPTVALPDWATLANGSLQGFPAEPGTWPLALSGADYTGKEIAFTYGQIVVEDGPQVAFIADQIRHRSEVFHASGQVKRKLGELRWEIEGDSRPKGLRFIEHEGYVDGNIPSFDTSLSFRLKATDVDGTSGYSNAFSFSTLPAELSLNNVPPQHLTLNEAGGFSFSARETVGQQSWSVAEGALPDGMSIDPATGRVSGVPTKTGTWPGVVVRLEDESGTELSNAFDVIVSSDPVTATVPPLAVRVGSPFTGGTPSASGGTAPYSYAAADGSELPEGVHLDEASGVLSGELSETGEQAVFLVATDSTGLAGRPFIAGLTGYSPLSVSMDQPQYVGERLSPMTVTPGIEEYSAMPPSQWSLSPTAAPPGLAVSRDTGVISGTPVSTGDFGPYTLTVRDASGATASTNPFTIRIDEAPDLQVQSSDVEIEMWIAAEARPGTALHAIGPVSWSLDNSSAALPSGLRLDPDGYFRGILSAAAPIPGIVLKASDSEGRTAVSEPFSIVPIQPSPLAMDDFSLSWPAGRPFTTKASPKNPAGEWTSSADGLPSWMTIEPSTGVIAGTAPSQGTYGPYSVTATDALGRAATAAFTLSAIDPLSLSMPGTVNLHRLESVPPTGPVAENAIGSLTWSISGRLPAGLTFDPSSGHVSGIVAEEGDTTVTFTARDEANQTATVSVTFIAGARQDLTVAYDIPTLTAGSSAGLPVSPLQPTNAAMPADFALTGTVPSGLTFDPATGAFGGVPSQTGVFPGVTVSALDAEGESATSEPLTFRVAPKDPIHVSSPVSQALRLDVYGETSPIQVSNAVKPLSFSTASGQALTDPDGLVLNPLTGSVYGVPHTAGERTHSLTVTDAIGRSTAFALKLNAVGALGVTMSDVSANRQSPMPATAVANAANAVGAVTYSISPPTLPAGVSFNPSTGRLSGSPSAEGTFGPYTLTAQDSTGQSATATFSIAVGPRLALEASFPSATSTAIANHSYALTAAVANAVGAVSWSLQTGDLPDGLSVQSSTGSIRGVPTETGTWTGIVLTATDSTGATAATAPLTIKVQLDGLPIKLTLQPLKSKIGLAFTTAAPAVSNQVGDVTFRSPQAEALGLSVDPLTGVVSGVIETEGSYVVDLDITDSTNRVTSEPLQLSITPRLRLMSGPMFGTVNVNMNQTKAVTLDYAIGSVTYAIQGTLPPGISFSSTGFLSGKPTLIGLYEGLTVTATDSVGDVAVSEPFTFEVLDNGKVPTITAMSIPTVLKVGTAMAARTPTVSNKKGGDLYTINKPLPEGLVIDSETGTISGTPAPGAHGRYEGYVVSVADTLGRGTSSEEFTISIRHQDSVSFTLDSPFLIRYGMPFTTLPATVKNSHAIIGTPVFSTTNTLVTIDPATGAVSGTLSSTPDIVVRLSDDIGLISSTTLDLNRGNLSLTFVAQNYTAGQPVDYEPTVTLASPGAEVSWTSQVPGAMPQGLTMDPATGRVTGVMPFGTYYLQAVVSDTDGTTVYAPSASGYRIWKGTSTEPLNLTFAPIDDLEAGAVVESEIVPVTGLTAARTASLSGWAGELRVCYDPACLHEKYEWGTTSRAVNNGEFVQVRSWAPYGSRESRTLMITVSAEGFGEWTLSSRETESVSASAVLPVPSLSEYGPSNNHPAMTAEQMHLLYDGITSAGADTGLQIGSRVLVYDFGQPVHFDRFYIARNSTSARSTLQIEVGGQWIDIYSGYPPTGYVQLDSEYTARRIKLTDGGSVNVDVLEFRIGDGGPHARPALDDLPPRSEIRETASTVDIRGTAANSPYVSSNSLTYAIVSGTVPPETFLSPTGLLSLPSADVAGEGTWTFTIRATDSIGSTSERMVAVVSPGPAASGERPLPTLSTYYNSALTEQQIVDLYDGDPNGTAVTVSRDRYLTYDFGKFVTFDRFSLASSARVNIVIEIETEDGWLEIYQNPIQTSEAEPFNGEWTARRIRLTETNATNVRVTEFRIGS